MYCISRHYRLGTGSTHDTSSQTRPDVHTALFTCSLAMLLDSCSCLLPVSLWGLGSQGIRAMSYCTTALAGFLGLRPACWEARRQD